MAFSLPSSVVEDIIKKGYTPQPGQAPESPAATPAPAPSTAPPPSSGINNVIRGVIKDVQESGSPIFSSDPAVRDQALRDSLTGTDVTENINRAIGGIELQKLKEDPQYAGAFDENGNVKPTPKLTGSGDLLEGDLSGAYKAPGIEKLSDYANTLGTILGAPPTVRYSPASAMTVDPNADARSREAIWQNIAALQGAAAGAAPSAAEIQMRQGLDAAIRSQMAQAASARGVSAGLAQKIAAEGIAGQQQASVNETARMRAAEQAQARSTLADVLTGTRGMDLESAYRNQQAFNDATAMNSQLGLQASTTNADIASKYGLTRAGMASDLYSGDVRSYTDLQATLLGARAEQAMQDDAQAYANSQYNKDLLKLGLGGLLSGAGAAGAAYAGKA